MKKTLLYQEILEKYGIVGPVLLSAGLAKKGLEDGDTS